MKKGVVLTALLTLSSVAYAGPIITKEFQPTPSDLGDLDHYKAVTWGMSWTLPADYEVVSATITIKNLYNWAIEPNILYMNLLDTTTTGVKTYTDNQASGNWYDGKGVLLTSFTDTRTKTSQPAVNFTYSLTAGQLVTLDQHMADGKFGLGFDPDCHFYNSGVKFSLVAEERTVPEPATLAFLGAALPVFLRRRRCA